MTLPWIRIRAIGPISMQCAYVLSGDVAERFRESYRIEWKNTEAGGQAPHWTTKTYDRGCFERYSIGFTLFPGLLSQGGELSSGAAVKREAEKLANLCKPVMQGNCFHPPPLCVITVASNWSGRGYVDGVDFEWEGPVDVTGCYTICKVTLQFDRHVGPWSGAAKMGALAQFAAGRYRF